MIFFITEPIWLPFALKPNARPQLSIFALGFPKLLAKRTCHAEIHPQYQH